MNRIFKVSYPAFNGNTKTLHKYSDDRSFEGYAPKEWNHLPFLNQI